MGNRHCATNKERSTRLEFHGLSPIETYYLVPVQHKNNIPKLSNLAFILTQGHEKRINNSNSIKY